MPRAILCGVTILVIATGCQQSTTSISTISRNERQRGQGARGTVERVDPVAGTLTVKVRSRQNPEAVEKTFQVEDDTTITSLDGEKKTELKGKAGLRDPQFKQGSSVAISSSEDGKVVSIQVGDLPRRGRNRGAKDAKGPPQ